MIDLTYLLTDWKELMETTHDRQWAADIQARLDISGCAADGG